jgi:hypothetical protein
MRSISSEAEQGAKKVIDADDDEEPSSVDRGKSEGDYAIAEN